MSRGENWVHKDLRKANWTVAEDFEESEKSFPIREKGGLAWANLLLGCGG
jgi:hypothetical protein